MGGLKLTVFLLLSIPLGAIAQQLGQVVAHDPVMIQSTGKYYVFATGNGISVWSSSDMKSWKSEAPVFKTPPEWAVKAVPSFKGHIWAPDISYFNGLYYLYYSVSAFGKNTSCIGLVTNPTLDPQDSRFKWTDRGEIIQSVPGKTNWNAIDPNLIVDNNGLPYLVFGSFWDGIKLAKLSGDGLKIADDVSNIPTVASRKKDPQAPNPPAVGHNPVDAGGNAIEAPFVFKKDSYYYLFVSIDYCCKGEESTYKMLVGRAKELAGPYLDDEGQDLAMGGGKMLLQGDNDWHGVGHNAVVEIAGQGYLVFHGYDAHDKGKPKLRIERLVWDNQGWPVVEKMIK